MMFSVTPGRFSAILFGIDITRQFAAATPF